MPITKTYTSNTLYNDSTGVIAFAEQLKQELINWANYHHVTEELGPGNRPDTQNALNNLFLSVYERFLTFLNDADATEEAINTWKEIENFLADYTDEKTLAEIVAELNANIESRLTVPLESTTGSSTTSTMTQKAITDSINSSTTFTTGESVDNIGIDSEPVAGSGNLVKSGGVQNELALGTVYDVSAKNPTAGLNNNGKWASLSALLSDANLNTLIPTSVRKGGMSIKFVQSSDNKYVSYFLTKNEWSIVESDWAERDTEKTELYSGSLKTYQGKVSANGTYYPSDTNRVTTKVFRAFGEKLLIDCNRELTMIIYYTTDDGTAYPLLYPNNPYILDKANLDKVAITIWGQGNITPEDTQIFVAPYNSETAKNHIDVINKKRQLDIDGMQNGLRTPYLPLVQGKLWSTDNVTNNIHTPIFGVKGDYAFSCAGTCTMTIYYKANDAENYQEVALRKRDFRLEDANGSCYVNIRLNDETQDITPDFETGLSIVASPTRVSSNISSGNEYAVSGDAVYKALTDESKNFIGGDIAGNNSKLVKASDAYYNIILNSGSVPIVENSATSVKTIPIKAKNIPLYISCAQRLQIQCREYDGNSSYTSYVTLSHSGGPVVYTPSTYEYVTFFFTSRKGNITPSDELNIVVTKYNSNDRGIIEALQDAKKRIDGIDAKFLGKESLYPFIWGARGNDGSLGSLDTRISSQIFYLNGKVKIELTNTTYRYRFYLKPDTYDITKENNGQTYQSLSDAIAVIPQLIKTKHLRILFNDGTNDVAYLYNGSDTSDTNFNNVNNWSVSSDNNFLPLSSNWWYDGIYEGRGYAFINVYNSSDQSSITPYNDLGLSIYNPDNIDTTPTNNSKNPAMSGGVKAMIDALANTVNSVVEIEHKASVIGTGSLGRFNLHCILKAGISYTFTFNGTTITKPEDASGYAIGLVGYGVETSYFVSIAGFDDYPSSSIIRRFDEDIYLFATTNMNIGCCVDIEVVSNDYTASQIVKNNFKIVDNELLFRKLLLERLWVDGATVSDTKYHNAITDGWDVRDYDGMMCVGYAGSYANNETELNDHPSAEMSYFSLADIEGTKKKINIFTYGDVISIAGTDYTVGDCKWVAAVWTGENEITTIATITGSFQGVWARTYNTLTEELGTPVRCDITVMNNEEATIFPMTININNIKSFWQTANVSHPLTRGNNVNASIWISGTPIRIGDWFYASFVCGNYAHPLLRTQNFVNWYFVCDLPNTADPNNDTFSPSEEVSICYYNKRIYVSTRGNYGHYPYVVVDNVKYLVKQINGVYKILDNEGTVIEDIPEDAEILQAQAYNTVFYGDFVENDNNVTITWSTPVKPNTGSSERTTIAAINGRIFVHNGPTGGLGGNSFAIDGADVYRGRHQLLVFDTNMNLVKQTIIQTDIKYTHPIFKNFGGMLLCVNSTDLRAFGVNTSAGGRAELVVTRISPDLLCTICEDAE